MQTPVKYPSNTSKMYIITAMQKLQKSAVSLWTMTWLQKQIVHDKLHATMCEFTFKINYVPEKIAGILTH